MEVFFAKQDDYTYRIEIKGLANLVGNIYFDEKDGELEKILDGLEYEQEFSLEISKEKEGYYLKLIAKPEDGGNVIIIPIRSYNEVLIEDLRKKYTENKRKALDQFLQHLGKKPTDKTILMLDVEDFEFQYDNHVFFFRNWDYEE